MQSERSLIPTPMPVRRHARSGNRGLVLTALCLAVLLVVMDNTIVNVAIPTMSDALNASSTDLQWVVDAYTLSFAALLLPAGKLSDRWGRRRMLLVGLAGFAVVSAATAFSWALWQLVTLRVVLGVCAALIYPATLSSIIVIFEGSRYRSLAVGLWAATSGVGIALGPIIGGVLLEHYAWNSIFWVCSVIGVVALACIAVAVPEVRAYRSERFDFPGTVLSVAGVCLLVWGDHRTPDLRLALLAGHRRHLRGPDHTCGVRGGRGAYARPAHRCRPVPKGHVHEQHLRDLRRVLLPVRLHLHHHPMVPGIAWIHRIADGGRDAALRGGHGGGRPVRHAIGETFRIPVGRLDGTAVPVGEHVRGHACRRPLQLLVRGRTHHGPDGGRHRPDPGARHGRPDEHRSGKLDRRRIGCQRHDP